MLLEVLENKNDVAEDLCLKAKEWLEEICSNKQKLFSPRSSTQIMMRTVAIMVVAAVKG